MKLTRLRVKNYKVIEYFGFEADIKAIEKDIVRMLAEVTA